MGSTLESLLFGGGAAGDEEVCAGAEVPLVDDDLVAGVLEVDAGSCWGRCGDQSELYELIQRNSTCLRSTYRFPFAKFVELVQSLLGAHWYILHVATRTASGSAHL